MTETNQNPSPKDPASTVAPAATSAASPDAGGAAAEVVITVRENGPYAVTGPARIIDVDGNEYDVSAKKRVSLCRCGGSTTKPFCDGTHSRIGFQAAERAVRQEGGLP
jgi:CDGSH-type Zn-finger protein